MDPHINELYEDAQLFEEGELSESPEYYRCFNINLDLEQKMRDTFGPEAHQLLLDFLTSYYAIEEFRCLHYFYQGYLAAKTELSKRKRPATGSLCFCPCRAGTVSVSPSGKKTTGPS